MHTLRLATLLLMMPLFVTLASAQQADKPKLYFSPSADAPLDAVPKTPLTEFNLRANGEQGMFAYVYNPSGEDKAFRVEVVATRPGMNAKGQIEGGQDVVIARWSGTVPAKRSARVLLEVEKALLAVPPPAPEVAGATAKAVPIPTIPSIKNPRFRLIDDKDRVFDKDKDIALPVTHQDFSGYIEANKVTIEGAPVAIAVSRKGVDYPHSLQPIPVRLTARDAKGKAIPGANLVGSNGTIEGLLAAGKQGEGTESVVLRFDPNAVATDGHVDVEVDGVARAFRFTRDGEKLDVTTKINTPEFWVSGKPIPITIESGDWKGEYKDLEFVVAKDETATPDYSRKLPAMHDSSIAFRSGANGEAIFTTRVQDWKFDVPTRGLVGSRKMFILGKKDAAATVTPIGAEPVTFDATPPAIEPLKVTPKMAAVPRNIPDVGEIYRVGERVTVTAVVSDPESEVDTAAGAVFYIGERPGPDGKLAPGSAVVTVKKPKDTGKNQVTFSADFDLPATTDPAGVKIGVTVANRAGQTSTLERVVRIDPTPPNVSVVRVIPEKGVGIPYRPGDTIRLVATADDPESKLDTFDPESKLDSDEGKKVQFFLGEPPDADGKNTQGTLVLRKAAGVLVREKGHDGKTFWAADFTLPKEIEKEIEVKFGAAFVNGVGAWGVRFGTLKVAPEPKDLASGKVKVKVTKGGNEQRQPGLPVKLVDSTGQAVAQATTDECGEAEFAKVLPGRYRVQAHKAGDGNARDDVAVTVLGGETSEVNLSIKR